MGRLGDAAKIAREAAREGFETVEAALMASRALARTGYITEALSALTLAKKLDCSVGLQRVLELESTFFELIANGAFNAVIEVLDAALPQFDSRNQALKAQLLEVRLIRAACAFYTLDRKRLPSADKVASIADELFALGDPKNGFDALITACELDGKEKKVIRLNTAMETAVALQDRARAAYFSLSIAEAIQERFGLTSECMEMLNEAALAYSSLDHQAGLLNIDRFRAEYFDMELDTRLTVMANVADAYSANGYAKNAISVLLNLSQLAHRSGRIKLAESVQEKIAETLQPMGHSLNRVSNALALADLRTRQGRYADARAIIDAELIRNPLPIHRAALFAVRSTAFAIAKDVDQSMSNARIALDIYEELGANDHATSIVAKYAHDLLSRQTPEALKAALNLLDDWFGKDLARGDKVSAAEKRISTADLLIIAHTKGLIGDERLAEAADSLSVASSILSSLPNQDTLDHHLGSLAMSKASLAQVSGSEGEVEANWQDARKHYKSAGHSFELANNAYILGILALNASTKNPSAASGAEARLKEALSYYDGDADMPLQAAQTLHKLAKLFRNTSRFLGYDRKNLQAEAALHLNLAWAKVEEVRRTYWAHNRLDALAGRRAAIACASEISAEALVLHGADLGDAHQVLAWANRSKAQALNDLIDPEQAVYDKAKQAAGGDADMLDVVHKEFSTWTKHCLASEDDTVAAEWEAAFRALRAQPALSDVAAYRASQLTSGAGSTKASPNSGSRVFVEWVVVHSALWMVIDAPGVEPSLHLVDPSYADVDARIRSALAKETLRQKLRKPDGLSRLDSLIAPLAEIAERGLHLELCPTGALNLVPFQALKVNGQPLSAQCPTFVTPSRSTSRHLASTETAPHATSAAVFGDPANDRADARFFARELASAINVSPSLGTQVTRSTMLQAFQQVFLVHYQGHAEFDRGDASKSGLILSDGERLTVKDLFNQPDSATRLVVLGACEGGLNEIGLGDAPIGLVPSLLSAGIICVVASLWTVPDAATKSFMLTFYDSFLNDGASVAEAVQRGSEALRCDERFSAPYYWASFQTFGDGTRTFK